MEEAARRAVWRIHLDGPRLVADVLYLINLMRRGDRMAHRVITDELRCVGHRAAPVTDLAGQRSVKTLGCRQRDTPSVGWLRALSSLACCCSANLSAASLLEKVATTRPLASPSLTSNTGPSWVTRYVLMALNMTWMQRRPKRAVRDSPSLRRELSAIICSEPPTARRLACVLGRARRGTRRPCGDVALPRQLAPCGAGAARQ